MPNPNTMRQMTDTGGKLGAKKASRTVQARKAREQFMNGGSKRDTNILKSIRDLFTPTTQQEKISSAESSYGIKKNGTPVIPTGQYSYTGAAVQQWKESVVPTNPSLSDYARFAAKADTATNADVYSFYNRHRLSQQYHDEAIAVGQRWMSDQQKYTEWILNGHDEDEQNRRIEEANRYLKEALHEVPTYDPSTHTYTTQMQYKADAPLPPWIEPTSYNLSIWEYYTTYSHDVVQSTVDAYRHALDEGREQARNPYKSAFAGAEQTGQVDSFLDVAIKAMDPSTINQDLLGNYLRDYVVNPIRTGHLKTAAGNALWNLMDTMDFAARGVRAFVAGDTTLGGTGEFNADSHALDEMYEANWEKYGGAPTARKGSVPTGSYSNDAKFKGQNVYWVHLDGFRDKDVQRAQELFMRSGGYELLLKAHPDFASRRMLGSEDYNKSTEELEARLDRLFEHSEIDWRDIYDDIDKNYFTGRAQKDFRQGVQNIRKAYTDVDANFNADTGNMAADMIIETVLDPGLVAGGLAKGTAAGTLRSAAENGVEQGFATILRNSDEAHVLVNNPRVRQALDALIRSNEGKNIIFKDAQKFGEDIDLFITKVGQESPIFSTQSARDNFRRAVTAHLMGKQTSVNSAIIASQDFARRALDSKSFKAAYYMDKAIDGIDSAIIKSSFFVPWAGVKGARLLGHEVTDIAGNSELIKKARAVIGLREKNALNTVVDRMTKKVDITKVSDLMNEFENGLHHEKDVRKALQVVVDQYDDAAWEINTIMQRFSSGSITDAEALRLVSEKIDDITGGQYSSVQELAGYVNDLDIRYAGDIRSAYGRVDDTFRRLQDLVDRRSSNAVDGFIDEVRQVDNKNDLTRLFREHMDNDSIMALRREVVDNTQFDITTEEIDRLVDDLRNGIWTDESVTKEAIEKGTLAQKKLSEKTLRRTIKFDTMDNILRRMGVNWREISMMEELPESVYTASKFEQRMTEFMEAWQKQPEVTYNIDDALKFVDRIENQIHFKEIMSVGTASEVSALEAHKAVAECNKLRKQIKRLDLVNLKDVKYIVLPQLDRMALNQTFINNSDIQNLYGSFYDDIIAPIWTEMKRAASDQVDLADSSLFQDLDELAKQKYGFDRTQQLIEEAKTLRGFSDDQLHSFLNTLATDFRFRDDIGNIDLTPGGLRRKVEATLRAQTGQSKIGMKNITDALQSIGSPNPSSFLSDYVEEFAANPTLEARWNRYVNQDVLNPEAYVEKQMLFTALADPSVIPEWNRLAEQGQTPMMFHINSTGLNSEINNMTSISFRKWVPIDVDAEHPLTIERLLDAMDSEETTVFKRTMSDDDLGEFTEQVIRQLDIKDCDPSRILERYKNIYGLKAGETYKSEQQIIEEACDYIRTATRAVDENGAIRSVAPTLVVHDLDGFNVSYFNNKVTALRDSVSDTSATRDYIDRIAKSADYNSCNTYHRLASRAGDFYYTEEQLEQITDLFHDYIDDINHFANGYRMNDMRSYSRKLHDMLRELSLKKDAGRLTEQEERFLDLLNQKDGAGMINAYDAAVKDITSLGLYPRQYAFISTGLEDNFTKAAMEASGRTSVNTGNRIYVDNILSYFDLETEDGFYAPIEDLRQMHNMAKYITDTRNRQIVAGAEEFLQPYKADFDRVIQSVIDIANNNSYASTKLAYMQHMRIPDNAIDSYLMAKKLYNDHLKYWLDTDDLTSLRTGGKDLDAAKQELYSIKDRLRREEGLRRWEGHMSTGDETPWYRDAEYKLEQARVSQAACDYINNNRTRMFDELVGGGFDVDVRAQEVYDALELAASGGERQFYEEAKAASQEAKEVMLGVNRSEWANKYTPFKDYLEEYYQPSFDAIEEGLKDFRQAKKEKWDYFFKEVKPERDRLDGLIQEARADGDKAAEQRLKRQRAIINDEWQAYNLNYMVEWFDNIKREKVFEDLRFKDKAVQNEYDELLRQAKSLEALSTERGERYAIAAQVARNELAKLAPKAENYGLKRKAWMEWHGDHILYELKERLKKELAEAKRGTLDPDHSILAFNDPEFKANYRRFVDSGASLDAVRESTKQNYLDYRELIEFNYEEAQLNSELFMDDARAAYEALHTKAVDNPQEFLDKLTNNSLSDTEAALDILQGAHEPEIFNWAVRSDYEKTVVSYKNGVMKSGLDKATRYIEANSQIKSDMRQLQHMDDYFATAGIRKTQDRFTASVYAKTNQLFNILEQSGFLKRESFHSFMEKASEVQRLQLQKYRLDALKNADGVFDRERLLSDMVYNGFNMSVFNAYNYTPNEMRQLREFVSDLRNKGDDFLSYYEDATTGNVFIYLNDNAVISEADGARWINQSIRLERPVYQGVPYAEFDELAEVLDLDDIEDFRGVYSHLLSCWEDTKLLSLGQINGTTGRTVSRRQAEEFIQSLPSNMNDWCTSEGLLRDELTRGVIYDPGFVINDRSDMLTDFLGTLQRQAETAKDDAILINEVFHNNGNVNVNQLAEHFSTDELIEYFGENPEYVVCTIVEDERTATGLSVRQINMSTTAGVEAAKNTPNTTILPYSTYYEISSYMNRDVTDNVYKKMLGKYMLVYKAFALATPGTWMRNFIDATAKAAFDNGEGLSNLASMAQYEAKAAKDIGTYGRIIASDASLLNPANWDMVQRTFHTDMTFEDFELLRGIMDSDRYQTADKLFLRKTTRQRQGFNVISGENIGLRNLEPDDISEAFEKYLALDMDLPLSKKEFLDIYSGEVVPDEAVREQFDDMFRKLSYSMRNSNAQTSFDKVIDTMFKPFGTVEECVRYAQSLQLRDNGFSSNQITRHIHNTQFYNAPTWGTWRNLEMIMPFVTFKFNNMMYWVRMMDENPRLFRYFEDTYRSVYETSLESALQEGVELDYENDYGLQSGGIPLGNGGRYLNLGSSFLSAMNDFYGLPHDIDSLNPLLRDTVRTSMYALGFGSKEFFRTLDLNISDDDITQKALSLVPGYVIARKATKLFNNLRNISTESGGPNRDALYATLNFLGVLGIRQNYGGRNGKFDFDAYQEDLTAQGKWYDANLGKVVDISQKNTYGANDPHNTFDDTQAYMLVHYGKLWDANQHKFVPLDEYQEGGLNDGFDFENDPDAWMKLKQHMATQGKFWDANQRKFVHMREYIGGGLNAEGLEWETVVALTEEKFPNLKWDANQQAFVERQYYISGGMNDVSDFREVMGLRLALYGETYDREAHKFIQTAEPQVVIMSGLMDKDTRKKYDNYYSLLGIPRLDIASSNLHVNDEGLLVTEDGKYVITGNPEVDNRVFDKFKGTFAYQGRQYSGQKRYSYNKTRRPNKTYGGRALGSLGSIAYQTGYGWNERYGYFREAFEYSYQYHSPQPGAKLNRLISPPVFYPYGGGYGKFSFYRR